MTDYCFGCLDLFKRGKSPIDSLFFQGYDTDGLNLYSDPPAGSGLFGGESVPESAGVFETGEREVYESENPP